MWIFWQECAESAARALQSAFFRGLEQHLPVERDGLAAESAVALAVEICAERLDLAVALVRARIDDDADAMRWQAPTRGTGGACWLGRPGHCKTSSKRVGCRALSAVRLDCGVPPSTRGAAQGRAAHRRTPPWPRCSRRRRDRDWLHRMATQGPSCPPRTSGSSTASHGCEMRSPTATPPQPRTFWRFSPRRRSSKNPRVGGIEARPLRNA